MGVDFSHCNVHFSYSGFNSFRTQIAKEVGINLKEMFGYTYDTDKKAIEWTEEQKADPLFILFWHSDCDGDISPEDCTKLAARLKEIIPKWSEDTFDKPRGLEFINGLEAAAKAKEPFLFR